MAVEELKYSSNNQPVTIKNKESKQAASFVLRLNVLAQYFSIVENCRALSKLLISSVNHRRIIQIIRCFGIHSLTNIQKLRFMIESYKKKKNNENIVKRERKKKEKQNSIMDVFANGISVLNKFHNEQVGIWWIQFGRLTTAPFCPHVLKNIPLVKIKSNILQPFFYPPLFLTSFFLFFFVSVVPHLST